MTSYIPGAGVKKPLNMLEGPVYPFIQEQYPRFVNSGKHWKVDAGKTMLATEQLPNTFDYTILAQSRAYNSQNAYGVSSHRSVINDTFRPPLITMEDTLPLSRIPRPITVPRINPGTADNSGGTIGYAAKNNYVPEIEHYLTDRVMKGEIRPTFFAPLDMPADNSVLPDLEMKLPPTSASAGYLFPSGPQISDPHLELKPARFTVDLDAGYSTPVLADGPTQGWVRENFVLHDKNPAISATAGFETNIRTRNNETPIPGNFVIAKPSVSASSGFETNLRSRNNETSVEHLLIDRPSVSASAGFSSSVRTRNDETPIEGYMQDRIEISASAGWNSQYTRNGETPINFDLEEKLYESATVRNAAPDLQSNNLDMQPSTMKITEGQPRYSYQASQTIPYADSNERTVRPAFQIKQAALGSYKGVTQNVMVPRSGIDTAKVGMRYRKDG